MVETVAESLAHRVTPSWEGLHFQPAAVWWVLQVFPTHSPTSHPTRVTCTHASSTEGSSHQLQLCLLAAPFPSFSSSHYLEGLSLPRADLTCLTRLMAESFYRFLKRLPLNSLHGYMVSRNHSHQMWSMQTPASHHMPGTIPIHAASFLKNRPLVPQLNYWKSKYRLEAWDYWEN